MCVQGGGGVSVCMGRKCTRVKGECAKRGKGRGGIKDVRTGKTSTDHDRADESWYKEEHADQSSKAEAEKEPD